MKKKIVLLGISGGIAAYKSAYLASGLTKRGYDVHVIMTENATQFITPITFESLTGNKALVDTFDRAFTFEVEHVSLAKRASLVIIAPATANVIAKLANGLADDMLTTTVLACRCKKLVAPAMNTAMYENPITQDNLDKLCSYDFTIIEPAVGRLACGDVGTGKMVEPEVLIDYVEQELACVKDMVGLKVLVTAGATQEELDPVRYITNHSTGTMGYALAKNAARRGAAVTLVTAPTAIKRPIFMDVVEVTTALSMFEAVKSRSLKQDIIIKAAAVADFRPETVNDEKIKKTEGTTTLTLTRTDDILGYLGDHRKDGQFLCGFSMETENMIENSQNKLKKKHLNLIVANNVKVEGAGFGIGTNVVTLISKDSITELPKMSKDDVAKSVVDEIMLMRAKE